VHETRVVWILVSAPHLDNPEYRCGCPRHRGTRLLDDRVPPWRHRGTRLLDDRGFLPGGRGDGVKTQLRIEAQPPRGDIESLCSRWGIVSMHFAERRCHRIVPTVSQRQPSTIHQPSTVNQPSTNRQPSTNHHFPLRLTACVSHYASTYRKERRGKF